MLRSIAGCGGGDGVQSLLERIFRLGQHRWYHVVGGTDFPPYLIKPECQKGFLGKSIQTLAVGSKYRIGIVLGSFTHTTRLAKKCDKSVTVLQCRLESESSSHIIFVNQVFKFSNSPF